MTPQSSLQWEEILVPVTVDTDPSVRLMEAEQAGLLGLRGYASGDRWEVEFAGARRMLHTSEVAETVAALSALQDLAAALRQPVTAESVADDGRYVISIRQRTVQVPREQVPHWAAGAKAGRARAGQLHAGADQLSGIAEVLTDPILADQLRLVLLGLMHGRNERMSTQNLADITSALPRPPGAKRGATKKTIGDSLKFGGYLHSNLAQDLIEAFGLRWHIQVVGSDGDPHVNEPPQIHRLRMIMRAIDEGLIGYVDEPDPAKACKSGAYTLTRGGRRHVVAAGDLVDWLGRVRGQGPSGAKRARHDTFGQIRQLLTAPSLGDQLRINVLGMMHDAEMTKIQLGEQLEVSARTVRAWLRFGTPIDLDVAEDMAAVFQHRWAVGVAGWDSPDPLPEMPGVQRLRVIMAVSRDKLARYIDEPDLNEARWLRKYLLSVGANQYEVPASGLSWWIEGLRLMASV